MLAEKYHQFMNKFDDALKLSTYLKKIRCIKKDSSSEMRKYKGRDSEV